MCIAIDNVDHPQLTREEREFVKDKGLKASTFGMSVFTAGGKLLGRGGSFEAKGVLPMLERGLAAYRPEAEVHVPKPAAEETEKLKRPPDGGLVLYTTWRAIGPYEPQGSSTTANELYAGVFQRSLGVDRLWVRKDEADALARGEFPASLKKRMLPDLRYASTGKVQTFDLSLKDGRLSGTFRGDKGDGGDLLGFVETRNGKVTRFDLLARGLGHQVVDCGFSASLTVIPRGKQVPVAVLFTLADPADDLSLVVPARANDERYLK